MQSDAPPVYITSPGAVPMQMTVRDLVIWRGQDNIFNISCGMSVFTSQPLNQPLNR